MLSMTGYGRAEYNEGGINLTVEIKAVNNRNFDFNAKMPRAFIALEDVMRKTVLEYVSRGRIDVFVNFSDKREVSAELEVNLEKAKSYYKAGQEVAKTLGLNNDLTVSGILRMPEVLAEAPVKTAEEFEDILVSTLKLALEKFNQMREIEGEKLVKDMLSRMDTIAELKDKISLRAPLVSQEYKEKLKQRITLALEDVKYDEARLLNEVAFYTDKVNIDEELTRLNSHVNQFRQIIKSKGSGKKLDFLMQEFNRETNTICSKSNDIEVTGYALELKNEIEKVREQVQNLE